MIPTNMLLELGEVLQKIPAEAMLQAVVVVYTVPPSEVKAEFYSSHDDPELLTLLRGAAMLAVQEEES